MTDADLIGYLLGALDAGDHAAVEAHLRATPDAAARLDRLRLTLARLEADREHPAPPAGLAGRTVARLAACLVELEPRPTRAVRDTDLAVPVLAAGEPLAVPAPPRRLSRAPRDEPESRYVGGRLRPDLFVACGIALFAAGLVFSGIGKVRAQHQVAACQNTLRTVHTGLSGYADTHDGRYPQVGVGANATAESFATALAASGQVPANFRPACPACPLPDPATTVPAVGYTYTLGYVTPAGGLVGLRRPTGGSAAEHDLVPISADYPAPAAAPAAGPVCPHPRTMNVLFVGGNVRPTTTPFVGPNGDHIFQNVFGTVGAGADWTDAVLGRPGDRP